MWVGLWRKLSTKNWCFWTVVLEKTLESPLDKEMKPVNCKGDQSWTLIARTDAEAEILMLWPPDAKNWLIRKDPDAGKDWRQEEKGMTEEEMVGWHHQLNGHEFRINSGSWWWTGRPGVVWFMGSQRVGHDWATELNSLHRDISYMKSWFIGKDLDSGKDWGQEEKGRVRWLDGIINSEG